jgi:ATP-dependent protease Clp ATPase subunit
MFELPSQEGVQKCIVTKDSVIEGVELELVFSENSSADSLTEAKSA